MARGIKKIIGEMKMRILFVDDYNKRPREIINYLESNDIYNDVTIVSSKEEAFINMMKSQFDLVIIDIKLPNKVSSIDEDDNAGVDLLQEIIFDDEIIKPLFIIGVTSEQSIFDSAKRLYEEELFPVFLWNDFNDNSKFTLLKKIKYLMDISVRYVPINPHKVDIAIITAVEDEFNALLSLPVEWKNSVFENDPGIYYVGKISTNAEIEKTLLITQLTEMGMPAAACETTKVLDRFQPDVLAMVGICAGRENEIELGDIIVADRTWDYGSGKIKNTDGDLNFEAQPNQITLDAVVKRKIDNNKKLVVNVYNDWNRKNNDRKISKVVFGALPSGSAVIANGEYINKFIHPQYRKFIGIDMETYGVYYACKNSDKDVEYFSIKAVSDLANVDKDDTYHSYCSFVSANFVSELIKNDVF